MPPTSDAARAPDVRHVKLISLVCALAWFTLAGVGGAAAQMLPALVLSPSVGRGGERVTISGSGFVPGNYIGSILWDGNIVSTFTIPAGGTFSRDFSVPPYSVGGPHELAVCAGSPCYTGDFEQRAQATFEVVPGPFNVGVQAIEVTQAVRTDIPSLAPQGGSIVLAPDRGLHTHVAGRRTIVRVYPWVRLVVGGATVPALSAELHGIGAGGVALPGSPLSPANPTLVADATLSLNDLRAEAARSWNFVLPHSWTMAGDISLRATANPPGPHFQPECAGCDDDHTTLPSVHFETVADLWLESYILRWPNVLTDGSIERVVPSAGDLLSTFGYMYKTWPIADWNVRTTVLNTCTPTPTTCLDPYVGGPLSPQAVQRTVFQARGVVPGQTMLFPAIQSTQSIKHGRVLGCGGHAGVPNPDYWLGACGPTMAHESAHAGPARNHAGGVHGSIGAVDPMYPDPHGGVEPDAFGFDILAMQAIPPAITVHTHDYMSYGRDELVWTSLYTWRAIFDWLQSARRAGDGGGVIEESMAPSTVAQGNRSPYRSLSGSLALDGQSRLDPAFQTNLPAGAGDSMGQGNHDVVFLGADGEPAYTRRFLVGDVHPHGAAVDDIDDRAFTIAVPAGTLLSAAILRRGEHEIARIDVSPDRPQVSILAPKAGDQWAASGTVKVVWTASDPGGDEMTFRVEGSADGGVTWQPLAGSVGVTEAEIDLADLPGAGADWTVRVQASDGLNVGSDEVKPVAIAAKKPQIMLQSPADGDYFWPGQEITLLGQAVDYLDGPLVNEQLRWLVNGQPIGTGTQAVAKGLPIGTHSIMLHATNSSGLDNSMSIQIRVAADSDYDGLPDEWEVAHGMDVADPNGSADPDGDGLPNWLELRYGTDPRVADSDGDGYSDKVEIDLGTDPLDPQSNPSQLLPPPPAPSQRVLYLPLLFASR